MNSDEIEQKRARIIELAKDNELINFCRQQGLSPRLEGSNETDWYANCPTGGNHSIMVSTVSNQWGCGYCRKNGGLEELKQFLESKGRRKV